MSKTGEILIIEDDADDRHLLTSIFDELGIKNPVRWFETTEQALEYLSTTARSIYIIFSDVKVPGKDGLEFKKLIDSDPKLRKKSIPFVFYSTMANQKDVNQAYTEMTVQGFFRKGSDYETVKNTFRIIFDYWSISKHPNTQ